SEYRPLRGRGSRIIAIVRRGDHRRSAPAATLHKAQGRLRRFQLALEPFRPVGLRLVEHTMQPDQPLRAAPLPDADVLTFGSPENCKSDRKADGKPLFADAGKAGERARLKLPAVHGVGDTASEGGDAPGQVVLENHTGAVQLSAQVRQESVIVLRPVLLKRPERREVADCQCAYVVNHRRPPPARAGRIKRFVGDPWPPAAAQGSLPCDERSSVENEAIDLPRSCHGEAPAVPTASPGVSVRTAPRASMRFTV